MGPGELCKVADSEYREWPPRFDFQPIFYPVTNRRYACDLASSWNVQDHGCGFVARFRVLNEFADRYAVQKVGATHHLEWWIPAEDLSELNRNIAGPIEVIEAFGESSPYEEFMSHSRSAARAWEAANRAASEGVEFHVTFELSARVSNSWQRQVLQDFDGAEGAVGLPSGQACFAKLLPPFGDRRIRGRLARLWFWASGPLPGLAPGVRVTLHDGMPGQGRDWFHCQILASVDEPLLASEISTTA